MHAVLCPLAHPSMKLAPANATNPSEIATWKSMLFTPATVEVLSAAFSPSCFLSAVNLWLGFTT
jgi:hypothetical protein